MTTAATRATTTPLPRSRPGANGLCNNDGFLRSWTLQDGEEEEDAMLAEKDGDDGLCGGDDAGCSALGRAHFFHCVQFASRVFTIPGEAQEQRRDRLHQA